MAPRQFTIKVESAEGLRGLKKEPVVKVHVGTKDYQTPEAKSMTDTSATWDWSQNLGLDGEKQIDFEIVSDGKRWSAVYSDIVPGKDFRGEIDVKESGRGGGKLSIELRWEKEFQDLHGQTRSYPLRLQEFFTQPILHKNSPVYNTNKFTFEVFDVKDELRLEMVERELYRGNDSNTAITERLGYLIVPVTTIQKHAKAQDIHIKDRLVRDTNISFEGTPSWSCQWSTRSSTRCQTRGGP
jgi:hypothetical protein